MSKTNLVLITADQMRRDCLGIMGHPAVETPHLDNMAGQGFLFTRAYSATPSCIPARAALLTGMSQSRHARHGYRDGIPWQYPHMLAEELDRGGYHTQAVGKLHVFPERSLCGFHNVLLHDGYLHHARDRFRASGESFEAVDDYLHWFRHELPGADLPDAGLDCNSWAARPWPYEERLHPTNWCAAQSIDFLRRRDPTKPFFLYSSFVRPHSPLDPPSWYFDLYDRQELPTPPIGDWADSDDRNRDGLAVDCKWGVISQSALHRAQAAYYGHITHIDHQIGRMLQAFKEYGVLHNTVFVFTSDHGDLLGDHNLFRKAMPYEGSCGVPLFIYDPGSRLGLRQSGRSDSLCELRDIMPTLLEIAELPIPETADGLSLLSLARGSHVALRDHLHGEHELDERSNHWIVTKRHKYVLYPHSGREQFFDLERDPHELCNLIGNPDCADEIARLRKLLESEREENKVKTNTQKGRSGHECK